MIIKGAERPASLSPSRREVLFASPKQTTLTARVARLDATLRARNFSGSALIVDRGRVLLERGYGLADRASGRANTADTLFDVGSVTKQFVAAAILQLEERGLLKTSAPLSTYLEVPRNKRGITLEHLLTHRSGLDYPRGDTTSGDPRDGRRFFEAFLRDAPLRSRPGSAFFYNNLGYSVLAYVVEKVSGQRFEDYLRTNLFAPAGMKEEAPKARTDDRAKDDRTRSSVKAMTSTGFNEPGSVDPARAAIGYQGRHALALAGQLPNGWAYRGATGVVSSVRDLYQWTVALRGDGILSAASKETLFTPAPGAEHYAFGWGVELDRDGRPRRAAHDGSTMGFVSKLSMDLDGGLTIIAASNDLERGGAMLPLFDQLATPS